MRIRSILYCLGRSNKSYYDTSIKHPGLCKEHFSWWVYQVYWYHFWFMVGWLTVMYFFKYQFKDFVKKTLIDLFFLWTVPIYFVIDVLSPFWTLYAYFDPIFYRNVNVLKWNSDWYVVSWAQYNVFYRYLRPVRYFFYLKIFWWELFWFLKCILEGFLDIFDEEGGPREQMYYAQERAWEAEIRKAKKLGLPIPQLSTAHIKSKVLFNKEVFYPSQLHYYFSWRNNYKLFIHKTSLFKYISLWL